MRARASGRVALPYTEHAAQQHLEFMPERKMRLRTSPLLASAPSRALPSQKKARSDQMLSQTD